MYEEYAALHRFSERYWAEWGRHVIVWGPGEKTKMNWLQNILAAAVGAETSLVPVLIKHPTAEKILAVVLVAEESIGAVFGLNLNPGTPAAPPAGGTPPAAPHA